MILSRSALGGYYHAEPVTPMLERIDTRLLTRFTVSKTAERSRRIRTDDSLAALAA